MITSIFCWFIDKSNNGGHISKSLLCISIETTTGFIKITVMLEKKYSSRFKIL